MNKLLVSESGVVLANYEHKEEQYKHRDFHQVEFSLDCGISEKEINDFIDFLDNTHKFSLKDIRYRALEPALKYGFSIDSYWKYIQKRRGVWK